MSIEKAGEFVEKFFTDDGFMVQAIKESGLDKYKKETGSDPSEKEQFEMMTRAAKLLGYDMTPEEYATASRAYFNQIGGWQSLRKVFHIATAFKKAEGIE
ncbi:hypothetical protein IJN73_02195 [Candidatus Saccharibacteria bacterium]|nr:hypothetical protein [Candidatus Saccharibacteria bacterium]